MSLYPSLEDMKVDQLVKAQQGYAQQAATQQQQEGSSGQQQLGPPPMYSQQSSSSQTAVKAYGSMYPSLEEYMGLNLSDDIIQAHMSNALTPIPQNNQVEVPGQTSGGMIAPITSATKGYQRAEVTHGIREIILCKDGEGRVGLRVRSINKGIFVTLVHANTPAALGGLRFGDQILQINGENVAGWDTDKAMNTFKKAPAERIVLAVRDRPFERTITMHKDSTGHIGFVFDDGKVTAIVKDSSAARNGMLTDHNLLEIDGQNVVGLKDKEVVKIIENAPRSVTVTIMPSFLYSHMMKCMKSSLVKKAMDHSIPDV